MQACCKAADSVAQMATATRERSVVDVVESDDVPTPFPRETFMELRLEQQQQGSTDVDKILPPPPQYDYDDDLESLPEYDHPLDDDDDAATTATTKAKAKVPPDDNDNKVPMDLESVASAIERLYLAAPQLHNQRVELNQSKLAQLESFDRLRLQVPNNATNNTTTNTNVNVRNNNENENENVRSETELEDIVHLIARASDRRLADQSVRFDPDMLQRAKRKRDAFVDQLVRMAEQGRIHDQDAVFLQLERDPEALLTLPEFIREPLPLSERRKDGEAMLTLPEFVRELEEAGAEEEGREEEEEKEEKMKKEREKEKEKEGEGEGEEEEETEETRKHRNRSRSLSAPPFAWLRNSGSKGKAKASATSTSSSSQGLAVTYVAENHENLHHILVFFQIAPLLPLPPHPMAPAPTSSTSSSSSSSPTPQQQQQQQQPIQAEIVSSSSNNNSSTGTGDVLLLSTFSSSSSSSSLPLPGLAKKLGKVDIKSMSGSGHWEVKVGTAVGSSSDEGTTGTENAATTTSLSLSSTSSSSSSPLLDATQLATLNPASFACASCSLPLVVINNNNTSYCYRDLPSEHWEELVESWMCHSEQKVCEEVVRRVKGAGGGTCWWPKLGEALVGGSYVLFEESVVRSGNLLVGGGGGVGGGGEKHEDWQLVRCLCGAIIGRCQDTNTNTNTNTMTTTKRVYRVFKYAIRPVCPNSEPLKIPFSAFVVQDMMEFVQAHATYRFVMCDEEQDRPRILIWLFKPRMRLAYRAARHHAIAKSANVLAAKVLFKLLGPAEQSTDIKSILNKYPGFPQAEYLSYPMSACRQIATMLRDSNSAYPERLRTMTGLEVGWLQRM